MSPRFGVGGLALRFIRGIGMVFVIWNVYYKNLGILGLARGISSGLLSWPLAGLLAVFIRPCANVRISLYRLDVIKI